MSMQLKREENGEKFVKFVDNLIKIGVINTNINSFY